MVKNNLQSLINEVDASNDKQSAEEQSYKDLQKLATNIAVNTVEVALQEAEKLQKRIRLEDKSIDENRRLWNRSSKNSWNIKHSKERNTDYVRKN